MATDGIHDGLFRPDDDDDDDDEYVPDPDSVRGVAKAHAQSFRMKTLQDCRLIPFVFHVC